MTTNAIDLPNSWERGYKSDAESLTGTYQHKYLDVEIQLSKHDPAEFDEDVDAEWVYDYFLQYGDEFSAIETSFDPPGPVKTETEAADWAIALMNQISKQYKPGDTGYVFRATCATKGEDVDSEHSSSISYDGPTCPVCDAFFFQFRGFDTYEQAQNHFEFMDDEDHEGWDISVTESG